jgi:hypothetical protein
MNSLSREEQQKLRAREQARKRKNPVARAVERTGTAIVDSLGVKRI